MEDDPILKLIEQIQAGINREKNFEIIFTKFHKKVQSLFIRKGFSPDESKDLTQDVFLRVFKGIDTFRGDSRFERWLWEIAAHIYLNEIRRRRTEKRSAPEQSLDSSTESEEGVGTGRDIPSPAPNPEEVVVRQELSQVLHEALEDLPDQMRRCCILRYERGLKYHEIATLMKISIETVKAHLHQARKRLAARLGGIGRTQPRKENRS